MGEHERVRWRCRRGKLELDLFLLPFFDHYYESLSIRERENFAILLEEDDPNLEAYLMGRQEPVADDIKAMVERIRAYRIAGH